ncbi:hypothetical protein G7Z17_g4486 [Cylindrodendrum hubeiense]|uniref:Uncharacterized protein n=1 Tax=Cylindrodendrum hubeiense TaxID=595255 RepID=A0A9P5LH39_9HYPO|nr:hypothetical protein G7Z17_g4486 [Cylindrodendrum hubeiense]
MADGWLTPSITKLPGPFPSSPTRRIFCRRPLDALLSSLLLSAASHFSPGVVVERDPGLARPSSELSRRPFSATATTSALDVTISQSS